MLNSQFFNVLKMIKFSIKSDIKRYIFTNMHTKNPYKSRYDLRSLGKSNPELKEFIVLNPLGEMTIDFSLSNAVYELNKAILISDFGLESYNLPKGYLIPPVPGRLDYLLYLNEFLSKKFKVDIKNSMTGLDIGVGANAIYCILGAQYFNWKMVGSESESDALEIASENIKSTKKLKNNVEIRHQENKGFLLKNIIQENEHFDFTVCNPPFHSSKEKAEKASIRKRRNLEGENFQNDFSSNFEGQASELWCNGGEALFIKRLIKESVLFKNQVKVFSSLVSKSENIPAIEKQLKKVKAEYEIIQMEQGNKKSRIIFWWY